MFFVNGTRQQNSLVTDRSFHYGDGCFTTILVKSGQPLLLSSHQERIESTCHQLFITPPHWGQIKEWIHLAIDASGEQPQRLSGLKVHVSRGSGGRGYSPMGAEAPQITIQTFAYPEYYSTWQSKGIRVGVSSTCLGINPSLAGLKHNNRLEQVLIKKEVDDNRVDDNIVLDISQYVIEMSASNIFWVHKNELYTPDLSTAGVIGIQREQALKYAKQNQMKTHVGQFSLNDVLNADEIFTTNALHGVVPVIQVNDKKFNIGATTRTIQEKLNP